MCEHVLEEPSSRKKRGLISGEVGDNLGSFSESVAESGIDFINCMIDTFNILEVSVQ